MWNAMLKDGAWIGLAGLAVIGVFCAVNGIALLARGASVGIAFLVLVCLMGLMAAFAMRVRRRRYGDGPTVDERERWIRARGDNAGALALMVVWSLTFLVPLVWPRAQHVETITVHRDMLVVVFSFGLMAFTVVRSAAIWRIRRRELSNDQG